MIQNQTTSTISTQNTQFLSAVELKASCEAKNWISGFDFEIFWVKWPAEERSPLGWFRWRLAVCWGLASILASEAGYWGQCPYVGAECLANFCSFWMLRLERDNHFEYWFKIGSWGFNECLCTLCVNVCNHMQSWFTFGFVSEFQHDIGIRLTLRHSWSSHQEEDSLVSESDAVVSWHQWERLLVSVVLPEILEGTRNIWNRICVFQRVLGWKHQNCGLQQWSTCKDFTIRLCQLLSKPSKQQDWKMLEDKHIEIYCVIIFHHPSF